MYRRLLLVVLSLASSALCAQRILTSPDLSTFTTGGIPSISVDPKLGWIYATGFSTRAMGPKRAGMARVTSDGVIDSGWQPSGLVQTFSHVMSGNGDLYVLGRETIPGPSVIARYSPAGSTRPIMIYRDGSVGDNSNSGVLRLYGGGRGRYLYFTLAMENGVVLKRIDATTGVIDLAWSYFTTQQLLDVSQGANVESSIFVLERQYPGLVRDIYVRRLDTGASAVVKWTTAFSAEDANFAAADRFDRVYVATRRNAASGDAVIARLNSAGDTDITWDGRAASDALSLSRRNRSISVVDDQLVVPAYVDPTASAFGRTGLRRFDQSGVERARWTTPVDSAIEGVVDGHNGRLYASVNRTLQVLESSALQPLVTLPLTFGSIGVVDSVLALPDGGRLFLGKFDVWYGGQRFQNVLRTRADGLPDFQWRVELDGYARKAVLTPLGVVLIGDFTRINGVARAGAVLLSLASGAAVDAGWVPAVPLTQKIFSFDGTDYFYFVEPSFSTATVSLRRLSLATGVVDINWSITIDVPNDQTPSGLVAEQAGGLWFLSRSISYFGEPTSLKSIERFAIDTRRSTQRLVPQVFETNIVLSKEHAYIGQRRYRLADGGKLDPSWQLSSDFPGLYVIAGGDLYFNDRGSVRRASLQGDGKAELSWQLLTSALVGATQSCGLLFATPTLAASNVAAAEFVIACSDAGPPPFFVPSDGFLALGTSANDPLPDKTVIEYFNRQVGRYFITGRANEQALLDAQTASFARTGMQFRARDSTYRDIPETPVCRLYGAPEAGGSNTHFYGTGEDCPTLNTVSQLRFEGFDFAATQPVNSACPAGSPNIVFRLFNNKIATNAGNHRYVVSVATKAKMLAQGWIDEGAVFCSTSITDAVN